MPRFEPFGAVHYDPTSDLARVTAPPYDVLSDDDVRALAGRDPHNIVRIDVPVETDGPRRYDTAGAVYRRWLADGVLRRDATDAFYRYTMRFIDEAGQAHATVGVFGGLEVVDGPAGGVLPHEQTTPKAKTDRLDLTRATRANLSAVWGLSMAKGLTAAIAAAPARPLGRFVDDDGVDHELEVVDDPASRRAIAAAVSSAAVVIADGHHRYAIARTYRDERRATDGPGGPSELTLTFVVELAEEQLFVQAIHRLLTELPPGVDLVAALDPFFTATPAGPVASGIVTELAARGALALVHADGSGTYLRPRPGAFAGVRDLDSARLEHALADVPHVKRYQHGVDRVVAAVRSGAATAGVLLRPVPVAEIERTANEHVLMPPKSTFFAPKPKTGLVLRPLD
jgi:uncharacterized protein (DUF1015 family)